MAEVEIPNLPGYIDNDLTASDKEGGYGKQHLFDVLDGMHLVESDMIPQKPSTKATIPTGDQFLGTRRDLGVPDMADHYDHVGKCVKQLPKWLLFDKQVLRFWAWTEDAVIFSQEETRCCRHYRVYYYLDDDTIQISEERVENSGMAQGLFLQRQKIPHPTEDRYLKYTDLNVQMVLKIFNREFNFCRADEFTREFCEKMGMPLAENVEPPLDMYTLAREVGKEHPDPDTTISAFAEALHGKSASWQFEREKRFHAHDREVLRFWTTWHDPQVYGQTRKFVLLYYIADDSISIHEQYPENAGTLLFPTFLARNRLPREFTEKGVALIGEDHADVQEGDFYTHADLRVGGYLTVYGRHMLLTSCDEYTKCFYQDVHGLTAADLAPVEDADHDYTIPKADTPPYSGFGTEEDSLASCKHLIPRVPRKDFIKLLRYDDIILRFSAKLITDKPEDIERRFVIEYFRSNDTLKIFEQRCANSGFVGGKFLERCKLKNPKTGENFKAGELYVGAQLVFNGFTFQLIDADESTMTHMESESGSFKFANVDAILKKLAMVLWNRRQSRTKTFRFIDKNHDRYIDRGEFGEMMQTYGWKLNQHELMTIWRHYDKNGDGLITAQEFFDVLEFYMHGGKEAARP